MAERTDHRRILLLIGAGATGQAMLRALRETWHVIVIDPAPQATDALAEMEQVECVAGDATSRLVLERAGAAEADAAIVATSDDAVNYEAARLAVQEFQIPRVLVQVHWPERAEAIRALGAEPIVRAQQIALLLRNALEGDAITATGIGLGEGELVEVEVNHGSHFDGLRLGSLRSTSWRIAAIYRGGELLIPPGRVAIQASDRLLLVGKPEVLRAVADMARSRVLAFPFEYGSTLLAVAPLDTRANTVVDEAAELLTALQLPSIELALYKERSRAELLPTDWELLERQRFGGLSRQLEIHHFGERWTQPLKERLTARDYGLIVIPPKGVQGSPNLRLLNLLRRHARCPILISDGSFPYREILVPLQPEVDPRLTAELACGIAGRTEARITLATVLTPGFISGDSGKAQREEAKETIRDVAAVRRLKVIERTLEGNPVRQILNIHQDFDLLVLVASPRRWTLLPDVIAHLVRKSHRSILLLPTGAVQPTGAAREIIESRVSAARSEASSL